MAGFVAVIAGGITTWKYNNRKYLIMAKKARIPYEFPGGTGRNFMISRWDGISGGIPPGMVHNPRRDPRWDWRNPASLFYLGVYILLLLERFI